MALANSLVCVPEVQLYQTDLEIRQSKMQWPMLLLICWPKQEVGSAISSSGDPALQQWLPGFHQQSKVHWLPLFFFSDWPSLSPLLTLQIELTSTATLSWNRSGSLQRKIYVPESWISIRQQTSSRLGGAEAERSWLVLVQGNCCSLALLCSARWPVRPARCISVYRSRHA